MVFLNNIHENNFLNLIRKSKLNLNDIERVSLYYILSGNHYLYTKKNCIYNFNEDSLNFSGFDSTNEDFSTSSKSLIRLAMNLFNGYKDNYSDPLNLLGYLDNENYKLAMNSIKIRFDSCKGG